MSEMSEMSDISEKEWKIALTTILEELGRSEYIKMLELLETIPECQKSGRSKEKMPGIIIKYYGLKESISAINDVMQVIPRNDPKIQDLLRPFVAKLKDEQDKETQGKKRKLEKDEVLKPLFKVLDQQESCTPDKKPNTDVFQARNPPWKKSICDVKTSGVLETEGISVKVVQKSGLRTYQTKEKEKRFFFDMAVADETGTIKLMVYGKDRFKVIKEDSSYLIRNLINDENGKVKVTARSKVSETKSVDVPEELQMEARKQIYPESPVYSVEKVKSSADKTEVSVEGTVTEIDPVQKIKVKHKRQKIKRQDFQLKDDTDSISICMWDEGATRQCEGLSVGDVIKVSNLKTKQYCGTTTLSSTGFTKIDTVQSVGIQNIRIEIMGIMKANKKETHLEAEVNQHLTTFVVTSRLLAKAFGFKLDGGFKDRLLNNTPFSADAEIQGNQIKKITAA